MKRNAYSLLVRALQTLAFSFCLLAVGLTSCIDTFDLGDVFTGEYIYPRPCYDCLRYLDATKQKPEWWPTDDEQVMKK